MTNGNDSYDFINNSPESSGRGDFPRENGMDIKNAADGNFNSDSSLDAKNSISCSRPEQTTEAAAEEIYCAESKPAENGYTTDFYTESQNGSIPDSGNTECNTECNFVLSSQSDAPQGSSENDPIVNNLTKRKCRSGKTRKHIFTRAKKGFLAACICLTLLVGIGAGALINQYVVPGLRQLNSKESGSSGNDISPDSNTGNSDSGLLTFAGKSDNDTSLLSTAEIAAKCMPSVVEIRTETVTTGSWMQEYITEGAGSGVIITADGYIVTNNHVIDGASKIMVTLNTQESYEATLIGTDAKSDLAVLKIEASGLTPATIGDSDKLVVGEKAVAIGNPLGQLGGTVTDGIISALDREVTIEEQKMTLLQTNAAINPGNSGGGLFDGNGNLIAIVDAKSSGTGIEGLGFAIPSNDMVEVVEQLMDHGYVKGYTDPGLSFIDILDSLTAMQYRVNNLGVYVLKVTGENASSAGFQSGDLIVSVGGQEVESTSELNAVLDSFEVGDTVEFVVYRGRGNVTLQLSLNEYVPESAAA